MLPPHKPEEIGENAQLRWHPDYVGVYAVSSHGHIVSYHGKSPRILKAADNKGYKYLILQHNNEKRPVLVHHLVLETYDRPRPDGEECRHLNGVRDDNRIENLTWGTRSRNARDRYDHGRSNRGEKHPSAQLSNKEAAEIVTKYENGDYTQRKLANIYGVSQPFVSRLVNGKRRRHLGRGLDPESFAPYAD